MVEGFVGQGFAARPIAGAHVGPAEIAEQQGGERLIAARSRQRQRLLEVGDRALRVTPALGDQTQIAEAAADRRLILLGAQAFQSRFKQLHGTVEVALVAGDDAETLQGASGDAFVADLLRQRQALFEVAGGLQPKSPCSLAILPAPYRAMARTAGDASSQLRALVPTTLAPRSSSPAATRTATVRRPTAAPAPGREQWTRSKRHESCHARPADGRATPGERPARDQRAPPD